jgi:integrase
MSTFSVPTALNAAPPERLLDARELNTDARTAIDAFYKEAQSANTARTYRTALQYWGAWHALRYGTPIAGPVAPAVVLQFIVDHLEHSSALAAPETTPFSRKADTTQHLLPYAIDRLLVDRGYKAKTGPWTYATVETRLAALSKAHDRYIADHPELDLGPGVNPLRDPQVRELLKAVRRTYARRARPPKRPTAATRSVMETLLSTCENDLAGLRDRALLLFGWASGGRRRSEITAATFENLRADGDGYVYELTHSKTNQRGRKDPNNLKPIVGSAAAALKTWLDVLVANRITSGPIFRRILNEEIHDPLKPAAVRDIIKRRALASGQPLGRLSAHSLRSGFVTEAGKQGIPLGETMALTGHKSVQTAMGYYHAGEVTQTRAARLLDIEPSRPAPYPPDKS